MRLRPYLFILLLCSLSFFVVGTSEAAPKKKTKYKTPPTKKAPTSAVPSKRSITLTWDARLDPNIAGYRVLCGTVSKRPVAVVDVGSATSAVISNLAAGKKYYFAATAYDSLGRESSPSYEVSFSAPAASKSVSFTGFNVTSLPTALANVSTRVYVAHGEEVLIAGFTIDGSASKRVALRALGPSLQKSGLQNVLGDPLLTLYDASGAMIARNDDWRLTYDSVNAPGLEPTEEKEAALVAELPPGSYTAVLAGADGGAGVGLFELYDLTTTAGRIINVSARGKIEAGENNIMIGGFVVSGAGQIPVMIRALGPSLETAGVTGALADPILEVHNQDGTLLASNDSWKSHQESEIKATPFAPIDDRECVIYNALTPGNYTAVVRSAVPFHTGIALVEVYSMAR